MGIDTVTAPRNNAMSRWAGVNVEIAEYREKFGGGLVIAYVVVPGIRNGSTKSTKLSFSASSHPSRISNPVSWQVMRV